MLLDFEVTNFTTSQLWCPSFQHTYYPNKGKSVSSIISKNDVYTRLEGMTFNQLLEFNIAIIAEFKKKIRTARVSKLYAYVANSHKL